MVLVWIKDYLCYIDVTKVYITKLIFYVEESDKRLGSGYCFPQNFKNYHLMLYETLTKAGV